MLIFFSMHGPNASRNHKRQNNGRQNYFLESSELPCHDDFALNFQRVFQNLSCWGTLIWLSKNPEFFLSLFALTLIGVLRGLSHETLLKLSIAAKPCAGAAETQTEFTGAVSISGNE